MQNRAKGRGHAKRFQLESEAFSHPAQVLRVVVPEDRAIRMNCSIWSEA